MAGPGQTIGFAAYSLQPTPAVLQELARRHRESNKLFIWTLIGGALCIWPLWIISYLEYNKMRDIKSQVVSMGVDIGWWEINFSAK